MKRLLNSIARFFGTGNQVPQDLNCPYGCGFAFDKMPSRRRKCPQCKMVIYASRLPFEKEKTLLTENEGENITIENEALRILRFFEDAPDRQLKKLWLQSDSKGFFTNRALELLDRKIAQAEKDKNYPALGTAAQELSYLFRMMGKNREDILKVMFRAGLMELQSAGFKKVKIISRGGNEALREKTMLVKDALTQMPLPCCEDCDCYYSQADV